MNQTGLMTFFPVIPLFVVALLHNPDRVNSFTGLIVGAASVSTAVFSVFLGRLGDRIGHHTVLIASSLTCAFFFLMQTLVTNGFQLLAAQILSGAAMGGIAPSISALLARFTRHGEEGAVYGLDNSISSGARALGPMIGVGVSALLGLRAVFVAVAAIYFAVGLAAAFFMPRPGKIIVYRIISSIHINKIFAPFLSKGIEAVRQDTLNPGSISPNSSKLLCSSKQRFRSWRICPRRDSARYCFK